jgi:hypothetical protein
MVGNYPLNIKAYYHYDKIELYATTCWQYLTLLILLKVYIALLILTVELVVAVYSKLEFGRTYSSHRLDD